MAAAPSSAVRNEEHASEHGCRSSHGHASKHAWLPPGHAPFAGKYVVERILGQGGMGVVFQGRHVRLGQRVAIKVLGSELREYPELVARFEREARACGSLTSAHAVRVFDIDATDDGTPFIVMELLAGRDLACVVERDGPQPIARSVGWVIEACDAIAEAHRLGIVHRDLKPSNLFLTQVEGRSLVKVLDFGIAKRVSTLEAAITQAVAPLGTPQYMSPEQVRCAKDVDARTDVWSLGVTLYELVTGQTPFPYESSSACIAAIAADPVPDPRTIRPELPDAFVEVLMKALAKSAKDRFQSIEELVAAIARFGAEGDDDATISAVRRALVAPVHSETLGEDAAVPASPVREQVESRSDRTVPPAVTHGTLAPKRRMKPTLAMACAVAAGLAALVLTPKCVAPHGEGSANAAVRAATTVAAVAEPPPPLLAAAPPLLAAAPPSLAAAPPLLADAPPIALRRVASASAPASASARPATKLDKPAPLPPPRSAVHGGLSSPGF